MGKHSKEDEREDEFEADDVGTDMHIIFLYGVIDEEKCEEIAVTMIAGAYTENSTIKFVISSCGGQATEMFSIYDVMRNVRQDIDISTIGLGKVMSAGVLLLAAGSKGKRKIGKHCKLMIHNISSAMEGSISDLKNDVGELERIENLYIKALSKETNMSKKYIKKLFEQKVDIYLTAEEAVELGIVDEVI